MGWYSDGWAFRNVVEKKQPEACGVRFAVDPRHDHFWRTVSDDGSDVRLVADDGCTLLSYRLAEFDRASRVCIIEADTPEPSRHLWLYHGARDARDAQTTVTMLAPTDARVIWAGME